MTRLVGLALLLVATSAGAAFDVNGVGLGGNEAEVLKRFPSAHCKALEWKSRAADRRCDDAKIVFAGVEARVTFYLLGDAIQAIDLRFATSAVHKIVSLLGARWGKPEAEAKELIQRKGKPAREVYKVRWTRGRDRALLTAQLDRKRGWLSLSRGDFDEEIYRVR